MNEMLLPVILTIASGYLLGSINSAVLVSRSIKKEDIRRFGSGNAGVTNMYRVFGKVPALITILGDFAKATLAVWLSRFIFNLSGINLGFDPGYLSGLMVLLGHIFPVYFGFRGGKGVMPLIGVLFFVNLPALLIIALLTVPIVLLSRRMSLGSVVGSILLPAVTYGLARFSGQNAWLAILFVSAYSILILIAHRSNIVRLLKGTEQPVSAKKT